MSLSPEEISAVKSTWEAVVSNKKDHGIAIYLAWFAKFPGQQSKFSQFASVPVGDLKGNAAFVTQCVATLDRLGDILSTVDNAGAMGEKMKVLGTQHKTRAGSVGEFSDLTNVIMSDVFPSLLGGSWTPAAKSGWTKAFAALHQNVAAGMAA